MALSKAAMAMAGSQPAPDEIINMAREQGLPETEIEGVFRVNADDLCRVAAAILAAGVPADSVTTPAGERENLALRRMLCVAHAGAEAYMDDGEAQDSRELPFIDFLRDTPAEIQDKLQKRMLNKLTDDTARVREEREAFKAAHRHLELDEVHDAWGQPMFKHSHVEASWLGWIARAARKQGGA